MSDNTSKEIRKTIVLTKFIPSEYRLWYAQSKATFEVQKILPIILGTEPKPSNVDADGNAVLQAELTVAQRKKISAWEDKDGLGKEALLKCLSKAELMKVYQLQSAFEIWTRLEDEYGHISDIKRTNAESQFYSLRKKDSDKMEDHINKFSSLQQEVDYHRPASIPPMTTAQINITFIRTLGEAWFTFQQAISPRIHTMKTAELFAEVKVADESDRLLSQEEATVTRVNVTRANKRKSNQKQNQNQKKNGNGYQGKSSNFKGPKSEMECYYCHKKGHLISECRKREYSNSNQSNSGQSNSSPSNSNFGTNSTRPASRNPATSSRQDGQQPYWQANVTIHSAFSSSFRYTDKLSRWAADTCSNTHLFPFADRFEKYIAFVEPEEVRGLGGLVVHAIGSGSVTLTDLDQNTFTIPNVLHVPDAEEGILSIQKLRKLGIRLSFDEADSNKFSLVSSNSDFHLEGHAHNDILYVTEAPHSLHTLRVETRGNRARMEDQSAEDGPVDVETTSELGNQPIRDLSEPGPSFSEPGPSSQNPRLSDFDWLSNWHGQGLPRFTSPSVTVAIRSKSSSITQID
jgi:hypothetical protein